MVIKIKEARTKVGLSQRDLAKMLGVSPATMNAYENGVHDPKSDNLTKIADICGVTVDYLLGFESEKPPADEADGLVKETVQLFEQLTDREQRIMIALAKSLLSNRE